jgi:GNAT superfamily N-acetyltransferase
MPRLEIRAFSADFLPAAGELLAARHRAQRAVEPLLPARFGSPEAAAAEVEKLWRGEGASGVVALRDGRAVGYLVGMRKDDALWGDNVWVDPAGHAVEEPERVRDLYAAAAARWVEEGRTRHYAVAPASDAALVDAWFRVGFGAQHAMGIRELPDGTDLPAGVRLAEERDLDQLLELAPLLGRHQALSPVFAAAPPEEDEAELRAELLEDLAKADVASLVYERDGRLLGNFLVVPVELSSLHAGLARPDGLPFLGWAATRPDVRGSGAGLALTAASFAWARSRGHDAMVIDWRETNLLSSRFWTARGFRRTFLRLYRSVP